MHFFSNDKLPDVNSGILKIFLKVELSLGVVNPTKMCRQRSPAQDAENK